MGITLSIQINALFVEKDGQKFKYSTPRRGSSEGKEQRASPDLLLPPLCSTCSPNGITDSLFGP